MAEGPLPDGSVSVVIPVLNAARFLPGLMAAFRAQRPAPPDEVVLVDSSSPDDTRAVAARYPEVRVVPVARFSHGGARNLGVRAARGQFVVLLTQDAVPLDDAWLRELLAPLADERVGLVFSRQVPRADASPMEDYFIRSNFPAGAPRRRERPAGAEPGFRDVFCSNVSAAARRATLLRFPFDETLIMSEDQKFAKDLLLAGYATVYQPASAVRHSHRYRLREVFRRYFDSVYSLTLIFPAHDMNASAGIGLAYLRSEFRHILLRHPAHLPYYLLYTAAKASGTVAGHFAERLPRWLLTKLSLHSYHWKA